MKKLSKYFFVFTLIFLTTNLSLNAFAESVNHGDTSYNQIEQNATVNINRFINSLNILLYILLSLYLNYNSQYNQPQLSK